MFSNTDEKEMAVILFHAVELLDEIRDAVEKQDPEKLSKLLNENKAFIETARKEALS